MAKAKLSSLDGLSDELKKEYKQNDSGEWLLIVDPVDGWALEDVQGLRNTAQSRKGERDAAKREVSAWKEAMGDLTPDQAKAAVAKGSKGSGDPKPDEKWQQRLDDQKAEMTAKHQKEMETETGLRKRRETQLQRELVDNTAIRLLPDGTRIKMVLPEIRDHVRAVLDERTGDFVTKVFDSPTAETPRMTNESGKTHDMETPEYLKALENSDDWSPAFPGTNATGGGAGGSGGAGRGGAGKINPDLPAKERLAQAFAQKGAAGE